MGFYIFRMLLLAVAVVLVFTLPASAAEVSGAGTVVVTTLKLGQEAGSKITILKLSAGSEWKLEESSNVENKNKLAYAQDGDIVTVTVDNRSSPSKFSINKVVRPYPDRWKRLRALAVAFIVILGCAAFATGWRPQKFLIGADNRYSNSHCQIVLWFTAVATVYLATVALRVCVLGSDFIGGVGISDNLLVLSGLSVLSYGGARMITLGKIDKAVAADPSSTKTKADQPNFFSDLVQDDRGNADFGDFQMILVTLAAVTLFLVSSFHALGTLELADKVMLPDVDSTILSGFGLAQAAYIVKKGASKPGTG